MQQLRQYQLDGIARIKEILLTRGAAYLADEMGLGKTAQAFTVAKDLGCRRVLVICPAVLRLNECREASVWYPQLESFPIFSARDNLPPPSLYQCIVVSYDLVWRVPGIINQDWDLVIFDEAHYLKGENSRRTKFCLGALWQISRYKLLLSGTPLPNGVVDGWTVFSKLAPKVFKDKYKFLFRYTNPRRNWFTKGWEFKGGRNLPELRRIVKGLFMVRRTKKQVLRELPDKIYQRLFVEVNGAERYKLSNHEVAAFDEALKAGRAAYQSVETATKRRGLGLVKLPACVDVIRELAVEKNRLVVFAHHRDVIAGLLAGLTYDDTRIDVIDGSVPARERDAIVQRFQSDDSRRHILVAQVQAAGVGINLTAADTVCFCELSWQPAEIAQAIDRLHRLGQKNVVQVYYILAAGTLDEQIVDSLAEKIKAINEVLR